MRNKVIWSFLSLAALAVGGLAAGCDSDAKVARSAEGESCTKTSDCEDNLRCKASVCVSSGTDTNNPGAGGDDNTGGGAGPVGPAPVVLGGPGETCGKRTDCADGLACISGRCSTDSATGEGGGGNSGPVLGGPGETCGLTSDCQAGLQCLPNGAVYNPQAEALGANNVGVCSVVDNGLEPTGKQCGAECLTAADCCELPFELHATVAAESCSELAGLLAGANCATAVTGTVLAAQCFAQTAYCECAKNTWACEAGKCSYTAACSKVGFNSPNACPSYTRSGIPLSTPCDTTGSKKCTPPAGEPVCKTDANCETKPVTGGGLATCGVDECTCYKPNGLCYRKCQEDLDCPANYLCDTKTTVCVPDVGCASDAECVVRTRNINAKCFEGGVCDTWCDNDVDCNYGYLVYPGAPRVCNAEHRCEAVGCLSDRECPPTAHNLRLFCADKPAAAEPGGVVGAITD